MLITNCISTVAFHFCERGYSRFWPFLTTYFNAILFWPFVICSEQLRWDHMAGKLAFRSPAIAQISLVSQINGTSWPPENEGHTFLWNIWNPSPNNTALHPSNTSVLRNNARRTSNLAYSVLVLWTSCYVPYCSIQTWRLVCQRDQISCYEWEWHLPQHFYKLLL